MSEPPLRNPFRSEADAFRLLVIIGLGVAAIVIAAKVGGTWVGIAVTVALLAVATRATYRWMRRQLEARDGSEQAPGE